MKRSWGVLVAATLMVAAIATPAHPDPAKPGSGPAAPPIHPLVAAVMADWDVSVEEATVRIERQDQIARLAEYLAVRYPTEFGGIWIDHEDVGVVRVAVLTPGIAVKAAPLFDLTGLVSEVPAERTWLELSLIASEVGMAIVTEGAALDTHIDLQANRVAVTIPEDPTSDQEDLAAQMQVLHGAAVEIQAGALREWFDDACTDTACDPPIRGGIQINGSSNCSTGFVMKNAAGTKRILTASHCAPGSGSKYRHNGTIIGSTVASRDSGDVDARAVGFDNVTYWNPKRWVFHQAFAGLPADASFTITSRASNASIVEGTCLCRTGWNSNTRCGVIEQTGANFGNNTNVVLVHVCALNGDSGGPYYDHSVHKAYGIHIGSTYGGHARIRTSRTNSRRSRRSSRSRTPLA
jgi:streptogrisin C